jgi:hypothetical protein
MEKYRSSLNHRPSLDRGIEISGESLRGRSLLSIPTSVDFRSTASFDCYDQGNLGSCTANATAGAIQFLDSSIMISRLYNYYYARSSIGTVSSDSGAYVSDAARVTSSKGIPRESTWPYVISKFTQKPPTAADLEAVSRKATGVSSISNTISSMKSAIASGVPVIIGFEVYTSFFNTSCMTTGVIPMPSRGETLEGGHCVVFWGYDDVESHFIVRNSWNTDCGDNGYFYMSYEYTTAYAWDPWVISGIANITPPSPPTLSIATRSFSIRPSTINCPFSITNVDSSTSTLTITSSSTPSGLKLKLVKSSYKLATNVTQVSSLKIEANKKCANKTFTITINTKSNVSKLTTTNTITVVVGAATLSIPPILRPANSLETAIAGTTKTYTFTIQNRDVHPTTMTLEAVVPHKFVASLIPKSITVNQGATQTFNLRLTIPVDANIGNHAILVNAVDGKIKTAGGFILTI